jgi:hypothetical protein
MPAKPMPKGTLKSVGFLLHRIELLEAGIRRPVTNYHRLSTTGTANYPPI